MSLLRAVCPVWPRKLEHLLRRRTCYVLDVNTEKAKIAPNHSASGITPKAARFPCFVPTESILLGSLVPGVRCKTAARLAFFAKICNSHPTFWVSDDLVALHVVLALWFNCRQIGSLQRLQGRKAKRPFKSCDIRTFASNLLAIPCPMRSSAATISK
jgi:hypothetical protein